MVGESMNFVLWNYVIVSYDKYVLNFENFVDLNGMICLFVVCILLIYKNRKNVVCVIVICGCFW